MMIMYFLCTFYIFGKMSFQSSAHFLIRLFGFLLLNCKSSLYILDINPLSGIRFANIFSNFISCIFILLIVSFTVQKLFSLKVPLINFCFCFLCFWCHILNIFAKISVIGLFSLFSSRCFIVSVLIFKALIHFE